ncbi:hypothetical protein DCAR_0624316 [Daucus carota subsp. sativus]|uniref:Uncharacterized protein n=1 Tax=Daucus carota subsp. sativus TaxID=79200 RepID=A0A164VRV1_DAUCS|nr:hypothetical protein DCAR_0624316 [Daucus carota subsp. sativus]
MTPKGENNTSLKIWEPFELRNIGLVKLLKGRFTGNPIVFLDWVKFTHINNVCFHYLIPKTSSTTYWLLDHKLVFRA